MPTSTPRCVTRPAPRRGRHQQHGGRADADTRRDRERSRGHHQSRRTRGNRRRLPCAGDPQGFGCAVTRSRHHQSHQGRRLRRRDLRSHGRHPACAPIELPHGRLHRAPRARPISRPWPGGSVSHSSRTRDRDGSDSISSPRTPSRRRHARCWRASQRCATACAMAPTWLPSVATSCSEGRRQACSSDAPTSSPASGSIRSCAPCASTR